MPYIQFDLPRDPSDGDFGPMAQRVADLYAQVMQTTPSGVTVAARELGAGRVLRDGRPVVAIRCDIRSGRPDAQREAFAVALTDLVASRGEELAGCARSDQMRYCAATSWSTYSNPGGWHNIVWTSCRRAGSLSLRCPSAIPTTATRSIRCIGQASASSTSCSPAPGRSTA